VTSRLRPKGTGEQGKEVKNSKKDRAHYNEQLLERGY
jgi:hypothetical protein